MRIAVIGPVIIENYGDHIIKEVLVRHIHDSLPKAKIDIFAVYDGVAGFNHQQKIFSISSLEKRHKRHRYDALILTGGSVIHFETLMQKVRGKQEAHPMWMLWTEASRVAAKYGIKLLWNSPEAPIEFEGWEVPIVRKFISTVDFLSVRDPESRRSLESIQKSPVLLNPDSGWSLRDVYTDDVVKQSSPPEISPINRLAVFHCNQRLAEKDVPKIIETLTKLKKNGFTVLLQPLAYTNSEEDTLRKLNESSGGNFLFIDRKLSINEIVAVFAHCTLYVGLSFHGAITTACYGGEVIAYDYEERRKTKDLYRIMGRAKNYTTTTDALETAVDDYLKHGKRFFDSYQKNVSKLQQQSHAYFDTFIAELMSHRKKPTQNLDEEHGIVVIETKKRFENARSMQELSDNYLKCYTMYEELYDAHMQQQA